MQPARAIFYCSCRLRSEKLAWGIGVQPSQPMRWADHEAEEADENLISEEAYLICHSALQTPTSLHALRRLCPPPPPPSPPRLGGTLTTPHCSILLEVRHGEVELAADRLAWWTMLRNSAPAPTFSKQLRPSWHRDAHLSLSRPAVPRG
eukprot:scaffold6790_cov69-Phaeocystis_antarctica.AAC.9